MYAFNNPFPYAYALIPVLTPNLILKYLFYNCSLFKLEKLFGDKLNYDGSALVAGEGVGETASVKIYHTTTSGAFN